MVTIYENGDLIQSKERDGLIEVILKNKSKMDRVIKTLNKEMKFRIQYRNEIFIKFLLRHNWRIP